MTAIDRHIAAESRFRREFLVTTALLALPAAAVLVSTPEIDLAISAVARGACDLVPPGVAWCGTWAVTTARQAFMGLFVLIALASLVATAVVCLSERRLFGSRQVRCLFVLSALVVGPGIVANLVLKDHLGRARPREIVEFGGTKLFTPALVPSRECPKNCSFISGEASSIYAAFFALAFVLPPYRVALIVSGIAAGSLAGAIRIAQGAHFLSDVMFAGLIMAATVSLLHIVMIGLWLDQRGLRGLALARLSPLLRAPHIERVRG